MSWDDTAEPWVPLPPDEPYPGWDDDRERSTVDFREPFEGRQT